MFKVREEMGPSLGAGGRYKGLNFKFGAGLKMFVYRLSKRNQQEREGSSSEAEWGSWFPRSERKGDGAKHRRGEAHLEIESMTLTFPSTFVFTF